MLEAEMVPAAEADSRRLMIVLHGLGDSMDGYRWLPETLGFPWLNYLLVNAPDEYFGGYSWFDYPYGDTEKGILRSHALLRDLLASCESRGYPADQTTLFGFSQGCVMTVETGLRHDQRLAGLVGISGWVQDPERLLAEMPPVAKQQRFLVTHGTQDPLVPFAPAKERFMKLKVGGVPVTWHEFPKVHTIDDRHEIAVIRDFVAGGYPL